MNSIDPRPIGLRCQDSAAGLEVIDAGLGSWMMRLSTTTSPNASSRRLITSSAGAVGALAQSLAPVSKLVTSAANAGQSLQVAFSSVTQSAIQAGTLHIMSSSTGALPMAIDSAGKIREIARVMPLGGVTAGPALLPILLPAAAAAAASYYQHQALQASLDEILKVVDRIEERMRDDDWAVLEAGDELARTLVDGDGDWDVPDQLRMELAVARQAAERVFRSRRRFTQQLVRKIDTEAVGRPDPWTDEIRKLVKGNHNWIEISIYLQSMIVRARLTAATAFVLATDGEARAATALTRSAVEELSTSYEPLLKSLVPLSERRPDDRLLDRVPGLRSNDEERFRFVGNLVSEMRTGIGHALDAVNDDMTVVLPAHEVKALEAAIASPA
jgi:hypothetical protein